jgi:hypothetical protein
VPRMFLNSPESVASVVNALAAADSAEPGSFHDILSMVANI